MEDIICECGHDVKRHLGVCKDCMCNNSDDDVYKNTIAALRSLLSDAMKALERVNNEIVLPYSNVVEPEALENSKIVHARIKIEIGGE